MDTLLEREAIAHEAIGRDWLWIDVTGVARNHDANLASMQSAQVRRGDAAIGSGGR
jgi:hypothetical protein